MMKTKSVYVVSSYSVVGENEMGTSGFDWYEEDDHALALTGYDEEVRQNRNLDSTVRLVKITDVPAHLTGDYLTAYLDANRNDEIHFTVIPLRARRLPND